MAVAPSPAGYFLHKEKTPATDNPVLSRRSPTEQCADAPDPALLRKRRGGSNLARPVTGPTRGPPCSRHTRKLNSVMCRCADSALLLSPGFGRLEPSAGAYLTWRGNSWITSFSAQQKTKQCYAPMRRLAVLRLVSGWLWVRVPSPSRTPGREARGSSTGRAPTFVGRPCSRCTTTKYLRVLLRRDPAYFHVEEDVAGLTPASRPSRL